MLSSLVNKNASNGKYSYIQLKDLQEKEYSSFYGIIYDATFPYLEQNKSDQNNLTNSNSSQYVCQIKVIDIEFNCLGSSNSSDWFNSDEFNSKILNLKINSNTVTNLPIIHHFGDIIRVHRGIYVKKIISLINIIRVRREILFTCK